MILVAPAKFSPAGVKDFHDGSEGRLEALAIFQAIKFVFSGNFVGHASMKS